MLDNRIAVTGKVIFCGAVPHRISGAGITDNVAWAAVDPDNRVVVDTIIRHINASRPKPFCLEEIQKELDTTSSI